MMRSRSCLGRRPDGPVRRCCASSQSPRCGPHSADLPCALTLTGLAARRMACFSSRPQTHTSSSWHFSWLESRPRARTRPGLRPAVSARQARGRTRQGLVPVRQGPGPTQPDLGRTRREPAAPKLARTTARRSSIMALFPAGGCGLRSSSITPDAFPGSL